MKETVTGIIVATLVLYVWGFLFWGVNPIPYEALTQAPDDAAVQEMLREYFPESGTYLVPGTAHDDDELTRLFEAGPIATVHIRLSGGSPMDIGIMIGGFILDLVFVTILAAFFRMAGAMEFRDFARLSLGVGAAAVVLIDVGDMIWWRETVSWRIWPAIYNFTAFLIAGHLLGAFMKRKEEPPKS